MMERTFHTPEMRQFCVIFEKQFLVASRVREIMNLKSKPNEKQYPNYQELYVGQFKFADSKKIFSVGRSP